MYKVRTVYGSTHQYIKSWKKWSIDEIIIVEDVFLNAMGFTTLEEALNYNDYSKEKQHEENYNGLCAIVEYLCELDNYPNVMDIQSLFLYDENMEPKNELLTNI